MEPPILIETPNLQMRHFCKTDASAIREFNSSKAVLKYVPGDPVISSDKDALNIIENIWLKEYQQYGYARYALIHKQDNKVIGFCGYKFEPEFGYPDLGYRFSPEYWGKGLMSEAVASVIDYGNNILKLDKVIALAAVDNTASNKILTKFGFHQKRKIIEYGMPHFYYENWL